jgi:rare lipoprotein A
VNAGRAHSISLTAATLLIISGCFGPPREEVPRAGNPAGPAPLPTQVPASPPSVPDAVPRYEPRSQYGNPPFYDVFGRRYFVLSSSADYVERGVASWYGPGFHKVRTSTGEPYDMYGMTAAHKTLPLPAYVRVTNLQNGRSVVVRVNDRGPFVGNRIIDLSYTAAAKLDMLRDGTAMVEVRSLPMTGYPANEVHVVSASLVGAAPVTSAPAAALFVQAGAFADPANAGRLADKLRGGGYGKVFVRDDVIAGRKMYRVRIGPVPDVAEFDRIVGALEHAGVHDAHLALD